MFFEEREWMAHSISLKTKCFRFHVNLPDGGFYATHSRPTGWIQVVLNYIGPNDGQGIRIYYDGQQVANDTSKHPISRPAGDGRIVVGRLLTNRNFDHDYASITIDELIFFNRFLILDEISSLAN